MKISKYVKLGLLMVISIFLLVWGLSYLKGHDFFKPVDYYYSRYERVDGLQKSSHVTVNGYRVGSVKDISFANDRSGNLIVTFMMDDDFSIPRNSIARIVSSDIMGTRSVKLVLGEETAFYSAGDTIPGEIENDLKEEVSLQVLPLKSKAEELLSTVDSAITVLTVIFNEDARKNLSESFENINTTINNLEKTSADLQELLAGEKNNIASLIRNMEGFSRSLNNNSDNFGNIVSNLSAFSDTLSSVSFTPALNDLSNAAGSLQKILASVESGQGSAGLLLKNDELYQNVAGLTSNLEHLLTDIRSNPKRYLHFSALNLGKEVYINTSALPAKADDRIVFRVHLISASDRLPLSSPLFEGLQDVEEYEAGSVFSYLAGSFTNYADAEKVLFTAVRNFPEASVVAFREGKIIKLEKALRMMKK